MATILLIGPDPETREVLKLLLEVEGHEVMTALGAEDAIPILKRKKPSVSVMDMIGYDPSEEDDVSQMTKAASKESVLSVVLLPRANKGPAGPLNICEACEPVSSKKLPKADLLIRKPYELTALIGQINALINNPRTSCSSRRDPHRRS
jgi:CheY-like chemotaxis protein